MSEPTQEISPALVDRARSGDRAALEELVEATYPRVRRWSLVRTGDPSEADDLTQEVLIRMIRTLATFRGTASFQTWLYVLTRNAHSDRRRRSATRERRERDARAPLGLVGDPTPDPIGRVERSQLGTALQRFLTTLPPRQREVVELVELRGMTAREAADLLEIAPATVRVTLLKARRRLRERILEEEPHLAPGTVT